MAGDFTIGNNPGPDWGAINLQSNVRQLQTQVADLERLLSGYRDGLISAFDEGYQPAQYHMLLKRSGAWPGITGGSPAAPFPFQISIRKNPSDPTLYQAMVNPDSTVMLSGQPNNNLSVTGLGTWFPFIANDVIALYIVVASYVATSATIQSYGMGTTTFDPTLAAWNSGDNSYVFDDGATPPSQIGINILLGYSTPDEMGNPYFVQAQFTHILLENCCIDGEPAIFDFSHRERYGITAP